MSLRTPLPPPSPPTESATAISQINLCPLNVLSNKMFGQILGCHFPSTTFVVHVPILREIKFNTTKFNKLRNKYLVIFMQFCVERHLIGNVICDGIKTVLMKSLAFLKKKTLDFLCYSKFESSSIRDFPSFHLIGLVLTDVILVLYNLQISMFE